MTSPDLTTTCRETKLNMTRDYCRGTPKHTLAATLYVRAAPHTRRYSNLSIGDQPSKQLADHEPPPDGSQDASHLEETTTCAPAETPATHESQTAPATGPGGKAGFDPICLGVLSPGKSAQKKTGFPDSVGLPELRRSCAAPLTGPDGGEMGGQAAYGMSEALPYELSLRGENVAGREPPLM